MQASRATSNSTSATATTNAAPVAKSKIAFFTRREDKGPVVELVTSKSTHPRSPSFIGRIDGKPVSAFRRQGSNGVFLGLVGAKRADGTSEDLGTANIVTGPKGAPRLVIKMGEQRVFASVSRNIDQAQLIDLGLDETRQQAKRAGH